MFQKNSMVSAVKTAPGRAALWVKNTGLAIGVFTGLLVLFDILCVWLCDGVSHYSRLEDCVRWVLPMAAAWAGVTAAGILLCGKSKIVRAVLTLPVIVLILLNLFVCAVMGVLYVGIGPEESMNTVEYVDSTDVLYAQKTVQVRRLLGKCRLFGTGDPCYEYPEETMTDPDAHWEDRSRAIAERSCMEAVFREYRVRGTDPVLCYRYGLWVLVLHLLLIALWLWAVLEGGRSLKSWKRKVLFWGSACVPVFLHIMLLFGSLGIVADQVPRLFFTDPEAALLLAVPQITVMQVLVCLTKTEEKKCS